MKAPTIKTPPSAELVPLAASMLELAGAHPNEFGEKIRVLAGSVLNQERQSVRNMVRRIRRKAGADIDSRETEQSAPLSAFPSSMYRTIKSIVLNEATQSPAPGSTPSVNEWRKFIGSKTIRFPVPFGKKITYCDSPNADMDLTKDQEAARWLNTVRPLGILSTYGVNWSRQGIIRDIWQNFYDGHGQTIDGVRVKIQRTSHSSPYRVTIEGGAEYAHHLLVDIGGTSKANSQETAGHFGEGTKIVALLLLRDGHASRVVYSSANWSMEFSLKTHQGSDAKMLCTTLHGTPRRAGNQIELEVTDPTFVYLLLKGANNFAHSGNPDMQNPTFSGPVGGFKYLPDRNGKVYVGGQSFSTEEKEDDSSDSNTYPNLVVWLNSKTKDFSLDRDRGALNQRQIRSRVLGPVLASMTNTDLERVIRKFEHLWPTSLTDSPSHPMESLLSSRKGQYALQTSLDFMDALIYEAISRELKISFPEHCLSITDLVSEDLSIQERDFLSRRGFRLYSKTMSLLGMPRYDERFLRANVGTIVAPRGSDVIKMGVLREATRLIANKWIETRSLVGYLTDEPRSWMDTSRPIRLFDPPKGTIFDKRDTVYIGGDIYWNHRAFGSNTFEEGLETYTRMLLLHRGSEKSEVSSYAITDFIEVTLNSVTCPTTRARLQLLKRIWEGT